MKLNFIPILIASVVSVLISYGLYSFFPDSNYSDRDRMFFFSGHRNILSLGSFVFLAITLGFMIGVDFKPS
jgi:hypothetical protein